MRKLLLVLVLFIFSCEKEQHGCMFNKTAVFRVTNESKETVKFVLIQENDTIIEYVKPDTIINYIIKAGVITNTYTYVADTLYRKTMDNWKMKRCELDGVHIR